MSADKNKGCTLSCLQIKAATLVKYLLAHKLLLGVDIVTEVNTARAVFGLVDDLVCVELQVGSVPHHTVHFRRTQLLHTAPKDVYFFFIIVNMYFFV